VFRGMSDKDYHFCSSLTRLGGCYEDVEYHMLKNFKKYSQIEEEHNHWKWMSIAQHHGLPTRLLDFTFSPFVAMHFATENLVKYDRDGVIWCVDIEQAHRVLPEKFKLELGRVKAHLFTVDMIDKVAKDLYEFDNSCEEDFALFFEPPSLDQRIVNQFAVFAIMNRATASLHDWLRDRPELYRRIVIPKELKWEIRNKLDNANITERMLFPGLDGLAAWLSRHYCPRPG